MWQTLPDELVHYILEFLWNDVWSLFNCSIACRRFYHSPICVRRLQRPGNALHIRGHGDLDFIAHAMSSKRSRRFFEQDDITAFIVEDVPHRPLAHVVPLRIAAAHVPRVKNLSLRCVDWTKHRPHATFFLRLAHFDSVTLLELMSCRFASSDDLRKLTSALPSLTTLRLISIHCDSFPIRVHDHLHKQQTLLELYLQPVGDGPYDDSFLAVCRGYSTLNVLVTQMQCFRTFFDLQRLVQGFPRLTALTLSSVSKRSIDSMDLTEPAERASSPLAVPLALVSLSLYELEPDQVCQVLQWVSGASSACVLEYLRIDPVEDSGALGAAIERIVKMSGETLNTIRLCIHEPSNGFLLVANALEMVDLTFFVQKDSRSFDTTISIITHALSRIFSLSLRRLILNIILPFDRFLVHEVDASSMKTHPLDEVLSRDVFDDLPPLGALLTFTSYDDALDPILEEAMHVIPTLFALWDARGILEVQLPQSHPRGVLQTHGH